MNHLWLALTISMFIVPWLVADCRTPAAVALGDFPRFLRFEVAELAQDTEGSRFLQAWVGFQREDQRFMVGTWLVHGWYMVSDGTYGWLVMVHMDV